MKTIYKSLLALSVSSLMAVGAQAATYNNANNTYANNGGYFSMPYIGVKAGQVSIDDDGLDDVDDPTTYGVYGGFNFDPNFGVELEYMGSDDADFNNVVNDTILGNVDYEGEVDVKQYGIYGTYRYYFPNTSGLYGKAKLGVAKSEAEFDYKSNDIRDFDRDDTSIAGGLGLGFAASPNFGIEAEYAAAGGDVEPNTITLGAHVKF